MTSLWLRGEAIDLKAMMIRVMCSGVGSYGLECQRGDSYIRALSDSTLAVT